MTPIYSPPQRHDHAKLGVIFGDNAESGIDEHVYVRGRFSEAALAFERAIACQRRLMLAKCLSGTYDDGLPFSLASIRRARREPASASMAKASYRDPFGTRPWGRPVHIHGEGDINRHKFLPPCIERGSAPVQRSRSLRDV